MDDWLANTHMAFWVSVKREIDFSAILDPLGEFGTFIGGLLPKFSVTLQEYIKIPLDGLPHFIIAFTAEVSIDCGPLMDVKKAISALKGADIVLDLVWPKFLDTFCSSERSVSAKISIGFQGFYPDTTNTYVELAASSDHDMKLTTTQDSRRNLKHHKRHHKSSQKSYGSSVRLSMKDLPICPPPVRIGGKCSKNSDCTFKPGDDDKGGYSTSKGGYCLFHKTLKLSIGCTGTCIDLRDTGGSCDQSSLNMRPIAESVIAEDNVCKSNKCLCGTCADSSHKTANDRKCATNATCKSGWCEKGNGLEDIGCKGWCKPKRGNGHGCYGGKPGDGNSCYDGQCTCGRCGRKQRRGHECGTDDNCQSGNCDGILGFFSLDCRGKCK